MMNRQGMSHSEAGKLGATASLEVHQAKKSKRIALYNDNPKLCRECHSPIDYYKKQNTFCSKSCSITCHNKIRPTKKGSCEWCNLSLKNHSGKQYCSLSCHNKQKWNIKKEAIVSGDSSVGHRAVRKYLLEERGTECEVCNRHIWQGDTIPIELDHIDGNHKNNNLNNVRLICPNCHAQTSTYKSRNIGSGRYYRRKRYSEGKSY